MIDPVTASIVTGIGGELLGGLFGSSSAKKQNKAAAASQERANQFTEKQMQNRHQWEVNDLRAAGLNPILSAGGTPSMGPSSAAPVVGELDAAASSAKSLGKMSLERKTAEQAFQNLQADTNKKRSESDAINAQMHLAKAQENRQNVETQLIKQYGGKEAMSRIIGNYAGAVGDVNPFRFNSSKSASTHYKGN